MSRLYSNGLFSLNDLGSKRMRISGRHCTFHHRGLLGVIVNLDAGGAVPDGNFVAVGCGSTADERGGFRPRYQIRSLYCVGCYISGSNFLKFVFFFELEKMADEKDELVRNLESSVRRYVYVFKKRHNVFTLAVIYCMFLCNSS